MSTWGITLIFDPVPLTYFCPPSLSLRPGAKICEKHTCRCGKLVEENGHHGLSCARSSERFSRHHNLNTLVKQRMSSIKVPPILEPNGLTRTDGKRPDGITLAPREEGKQFVWDVTCVDLLAPSRIENGSVANRVAVNRSNFSGRKDRGRTFWSNCRDRKECDRILSYLLYGSVASLPSPSSNIEAWPYGTSLRFASLLHSGH